MAGTPSLDAEATDEDDSDEGKEDGLEYLDELEDKASEYVDLDQLNGDEDSDKGLTNQDEAGSQMEDERSEFDYGDLEEHIMEDNDEDDDEDDLEESDFGAEDGEGAADNEDNNYDY